MKKSFEVTIPVLNEELRLESGIRSTFDYFDCKDLTNWAVVIADNGSDDATPVLARQLCFEYGSRLRYIRIDQRGVGLAIRKAWLSSQADIVGYMDVDLATALQHLLDVEKIFDINQADIVNGSRLLPQSDVTGRTFFREVLSRGLNLILKWRLKVNFTDAMCGFKFIKREVALELLKQIPVMPSWFVAAELLIRGEWNKSIIVELPIVWNDDPNSKVKAGELIRQYLGHIERLRKERGVI